ncbi:hypothetical protein HYFRA_00007949 [Hymenoscyphus fraxineus]|uniref:Enoyl reductase (ER) domain-containing protein n=1 Tax=Hymenoscyphus fraxineus TaxID=746836 RepID=A0A9N9PR73_9HELO|nr:hypothetical protein HYFRA_00007949 [Hymenoscyphus fraxineus]
MAYPETMKAIIFTNVPAEYKEGSVTDLHLKSSHPVPKPSEKQVLVKVHAVAITPYELTWPAPTDTPRVVCQDIAGEIVTAPAGSGFETGDRVYGLLEFYGQGGMAEYTVTEPEMLAKIPEGLDYVQAASIPRASLTIWQGLKEPVWKKEGGAVVKEGDNVLILGATGAVGRMAVQMTREWVGKNGKVVAMGGLGGEDLKELGADAVINYREVKDWALEVTKLGILFNLIFDCVGKKTLEAAIPLVQGGGMIGTIASPPPEEYHIEGWDVLEKAGRGFFFIVDGNSGSGKQLTEISGLVKKGAIVPSVSAIIDGLDEKAVQDGWSAALKGGVRGKPGSSVVKIL